MTNKRIEELREWLDGQISVEPFLSPVVTSRVAKENAVNLADLLALLSDYEAAMPMLEAAKRAKFEAVYPDYATDPHGVEMGHYGPVPATSEPYIHCEDDQPLRSAALVYKERSKR